MTDPIQSLKAMIETRKFIPDPERIGICDIPNVNKFTAAAWDFATDAQALLSRYEAMEKALRNIYTGCHPEFVVKQIIQDALSGEGPKP